MLFAFYFTSGLSNDFTNLEWVVVYSSFVVMVAGGIYLWLLSQSGVPNALHIGFYVFFGCSTLALGWICTETYSEMVANVQLSLIGEAWVTLSFFVASYMNICTASKVRRRLSFEEWSKVLGWLGLWSVVSYVATVLLGGLVVINILVFVLAQGLGFFALIRGFVYEKSLKTIRHLFWGLQVALLVFSLWMLVNLPAGHLVNVTVVVGMLTAVGFLLIGGYAEHLSLQPEKEKQAHLRQSTTFISPQSLKYLRYAYRRKKK